MAKLTEYRKKRNLRKSGEPAGGKAKGKPIFVIQKHDATALHYDFRLEIDGVLVSWAVPKGPSTNPEDKRLAIRTEDHPMNYANFEGVIPEDHYGAGPVIIWDRGTFRNLGEKDLSKQVRDGHVKVELKGRKLKGGFALNRMRGGEKEQWLLVKIRDDEADARRNPVSSQPKSVKSGKTIEEVAGED